MGNGLFDDDDHENEETPLVKQLRQQLKAKDKELDTLRGEVTQIRTETRSKSLADLLQAKGVTPKAAKFYPSDLEVNEESLAKWLEADGDVFAPAQPNPQGQQEPAQENNGGNPTEQTPDKPDDQVPAWMQQMLKIQAQEQAGDAVVPSTDTQKAAQLAAAYQNASSSREFLQNLQGGLPG